MNFGIAVIIFLSVIIQALTFMLGFQLGEKEAKKDFEEKSVAMVEEILKDMKLK
jgi:hypothetical protein